MKSLDRGSSLFWLLLSFYAVIEAVRLGIGTLRNPGMGFMSFSASGLLGIVSLVILAQSFLRKEDQPPHDLFSAGSWSKVILVLLAILLYAVFLPVLGYLLGTFFLMSLLFWVASPRTTWRVLLYSVLTTAITYYVFAKLLSAQLPEGLIWY